MARNQKGKKKSMLKQMAVKSKAKVVQKVLKDAKRPVSRMDLLSVQKTINIRTDSALMGVAAIAEILVEKKLCTYEEVKIKEKSMLEILTIIRKGMAAAYKDMGNDAEPADIGAYVYKVAIEAKVDKDLLINIFGIKPSESRILKPSQVKKIITL